MYPAFLLCAFHKILKPAFQGRGIPGEKQQKMYLLRQENTTVFSYSQQNNNKSSLDNPRKIAYNVPEL